jgi:hypothetical protein
MFGLLGSCHVSDYFWGSKEGCSVSVFRSVEMGIYIEINIGLKQHNTSASYYGPHKRNTWKNSDEMFKQN